MGRPVGVTILAILNFIGAAFWLLGGIVMILGGGFIATMLSQQGQGSAGAAGILAGLGAAGRSVASSLLAESALSWVLAYGSLKDGHASSRSSSPRSSEPSDYWDCSAALFTLAYLPP